MHEHPLWRAIVPSVGGGNHNFTVCGLFWMGGYPGKRAWPPEEPGACGVAERAAADAESAFQRYEKERSGLGREFLTEVGRTIHAVAESPQGYPVVHRHTRRALLSRFPYSVFYCVLVDWIVVVAIFHAKRNPTNWKARR